MNVSAVNRKTLPRCSGALTSSAMVRHQTETCLVPYTPRATTSIDDRGPEWTVAEYLIGSIWASRTARTRHHSGTHAFRELLSHLVRPCRPSYASRHAVTDLNDAMRAHKEYDWPLLASQSASLSAKLVSSTESFTPYAGYIRANGTQSSRSRLHTSFLARAMWVVNFGISKGRSESRGSVLKPTRGHDRRTSTSSPYMQYSRATRSRMRGAGRVVNPSFTSVTPTDGRPRCATASSRISRTMMTRQLT